jgi:hypothetical protein
VNKLLILATALLAPVVFFPVAAAPAVSATARLEVRGGIVHLLAPGDRVAAEYSVHSGSQRVLGTLYVRSDRQKAFQHIPLTRPRNYRSSVPARLLRGRQLLYYAVFHDPKSGRSLTLPKGGARAPATAWILSKAILIRLGSHRFGQTRPAEAIVARARADEVGWDINEAEGFHLGPQTLQVGFDRSIWLEDSFNGRLLVWRPGVPDHFARSVPVPYGAGISDVAFGPSGTLYVTRKLVDPARLVLDKLDATNGRLLWEHRIGREYAGGPTGDSYPVIGSDSPLRVDPDGTLRYAVMTGLGDERGWLPVATPAGKPLPAAAQLGGINSYQSVAGGLRLLGPEFYVPHQDTAPHEARYALLDRRGRLVRAWRVVSRTEFNFIHPIVPSLVGGQPVIVLDFLKSEGARQTWEYEILRLGRQGASVQFSLPRAVWGDGSLDDLRIGPDGKLYQLATSPTAGVLINRYPLR